MIGIRAGVSFLIQQLLNSLTLSAMLFLVAVGLSLVFGVLRIINFAHGVFYLLGAYTGFALVSWLGSFWLACVFAPVIVGAIGAFLEIINLRPLYRSAPIYQLLVTFGLALILEELVRMGFGSQPQPVEIPKILAGSVQVLGTVYPQYRLFVIGVAVLIACGLWLFLRLTNAGLVIRAVAQNSEMASCMGADIRKVRTGVFALGCALAALGGAIAAPMTTAYLGMGISVIVDAFVVVVIGGMGSFVGSIAGSLIVGFSQSWGELYFSEGAMATIYVAMAAVLLLRRQGLFGEVE